MTQFSLIIQLSPGIFLTINLVKDLVKIIECCHHEI